MDPREDGELQAIVQLLADPDPETSHLLRRHLADMRRPALEQLLGLAERQGSPARGELSGFLHRRVRAEMAEELRGLSHEAEPDLMELLLFLGRFGNPEFSSASVVHAVNRLAECCGEAMMVAHDARASALAIAHVLGEELSYRGNEDDYYAPANSFLDEVLVTRLGIPISLSALYLLVAERSGVPLRGVGLPGHFIVGLFDDAFSSEPSLLLDPYGRGRVLDRVDCAEIVQSHNFIYHPDYLLPVNNHYIFTRLLHNLLSVYQRRGERPECELLSLYLHIWTLGEG